MTRRRRRSRARPVVVLCIVVWLLGASIAPVLAASPAPSIGSDYGGDTRTAGQGPGLVGSPLYAIGGVLAVALISIALTTAYVRASSPRRRDATATVVPAAGSPSASVDEAERP